MEDMMEMMPMMKEMMSKIDIMMKAMNIKSMPEKDYMAMSDEEKDMKDEEDMKRA